MIENKEPYTPLWCMPYGLLLWESDKANAEAEVFRMADEDLIKVAIDLHGSRLCERSELPKAVRGRGI